MKRGGRIDRLLNERKVGSKEHRVFVFIALVSIIFHTPAMLFPEMASHSSIYNYIWTAQFAEAFSSGTYYPRWFPQSFENLGAPTFYFYPPFAFWVSGAWASLGFDPMMATASAATLFGAASGFAMYFWLKGRTPHALAGAVIYMIAPYHLYDFYVRGALAEYASFIWPPLIFLAIDGLPKTRSTLLLAVSYAGLLLTHLPIALLATAFLIFPYALYRAYSAREKVMPGLVGGTLGTALASFYLVPALTLQKYISAEWLWSQYYQPAYWFPWNNTDATYLTGLTALAVTLTIIGASTRNFWGIVTCVAGAASIGLVPFIWDIDVLSRVQFPWRLLGLIEFAAITAVLLGPRSKPLLRIGLVFGTLPVATLLLMAFAVMREPVDFEAIDENRPDAPEYLPPGLESGTTETQRWPDLSAFEHLPRGQRHFASKAGRVDIGHSDFPIWQVVYEGKVIPHSGPLISFDAPAPGIYTVERKWLPQEVVGWATSVLATLLMLIIWLRSRMLAAGRSAVEAPLSESDSELSNVIS